MNKLRIIFMGTPKFGSMVLSNLCEIFDIVAVVCQPDKPNLRNNRIEFCEVKKFALTKSLPLFQFNNVSNEGEETLRNFNADVIVTASYGQLLKSNILSLCPYGVVNVHASILPKYRGASPIMSAILNGDEETGVSIMKTDIGMDDGDIYKIGKTNIEPNETAGDLSDRLASLGSVLLIEVLSNLDNFVENKYCQDEKLASYCKKISKTESFIDWKESATNIHNKIRAFNPSIIAKFHYNSIVFRIYESSIVDVEGDYECGEILEASPKKGLLIKAGTGAISIAKIQAPNGKILDTKNFLNGYKFNVGDRVE